MVILNVSSPKILSPTVRIPTRTNITLFVLNELPQVATELKLQKLIFQVQNLARVSGGYRYFKNHFGPYSKELSMDTGTLANENLIEKEIVLGREHLYSVFKITERGRDYFKNYVAPNIDPQELLAMQKVLDQYSEYDHYQLARIVYEEWKIDEPQSIGSEIQVLKEDLQAIMDYWQTCSLPDCAAITRFLAFLEYSLEALVNAASNTDIVVKSVLARAIRELVENLESIARVCTNQDACLIEPDKGLCRHSDPSVHEVFGFIEDFCEKHGILRKLSKIPLEELVTEDEYKRLQDAFKNFTI